MTTIPTTQNEAWGFWGTIECHFADKPAAGANTAEAWRLAMTAVAAATQCTPDEVRAFLDSRHGRHFADDVTNEIFAKKSLPAAIEAAVTRWMGWKISRRTAREEGIPQGLPYLTGFVLAEAIATEAAEAEAA